VRGYLGHVVVGDLQNPEAATPCQERVPNRPVLAVGDKGGRVDRLTGGELQQVTALAADAPTLTRADDRAGRRQTCARLDREAAASR
jgi:hypothetical protein